MGSEAAGCRGRDSGCAQLRPCDKMASRAVIESKALGGSRSRHVLVPVFATRAVECDGRDLYEYETALGLTTTVASRVGIYDISHASAPNYGRRA